MTYDELLQQYIAAGGSAPIQDGEYRLGTQSTVALPAGRSAMMDSAGESPSAANIVLSVASIASNGSRVCTELVDQVIKPGGALFALGAGLTPVASGIEYR